MVEGRSPNLDNKGISIGQGSHLQEQIKDEFIIKNIVQEHNITYSYGCWVYTNLRMIRECIERGSGGGMPMLKLQLPVDLSKSHILPHLQKP